MTGGEWIKANNVADSYGEKLGRDAIETAISFIKGQDSMKALEWSEGLALVAKKQCIKLSGISRVHDEIENSFMQDFGESEGTGNNHFLGESTGFGAFKGRELVKDMLIDQGFDGTMERKNLYNQKFKYAGVA